MPAFDPVRDAVLNSPSVASPSGANGPRFSSPLASPSLGRRATDLSVLLDSDEHVEPTPALQPKPLPFPRAAQPEPEPDTLARSAPIRRSSSSQFPAPRPLTPQPSTPPPPPKPRVQYMPQNRVTPAGSVMIPLSTSEIDHFKSYRGKGTARLSKRRRSPDSDDTLLGQPPPKKLAGDVGKVVAHYNARPEVGLVQRQESPIIGLKNFNNWIKSVMITRFAHPAMTVMASHHPANGIGMSRPPKTVGKVLDMGIGKGGDLTKWSKARINTLIGADIASVSVEQARLRWQTLRGTRFDAKFAAVDCYTEPLSNAFSLSDFEPPFDVVSMQFCMHYAFESEDKVRCMLRNVTRWLRRGGVFIGTIPNAEQLLEKLDTIPPNESDLSFGNPVYRIRFDDRSSRPLYGHKYHFFLQDAVDDVPEYIVHWDNFVELSSQFGLRLTYREEFHQVFEEHQSHPEFGPLLIKMRVTDAEGESSMDEDQWEAANVYIAFAFEKCS